MQSLKTLSTQLAIVLALLTQANVGGQDLANLNIGQSYFQTHQPFIRAESECERNVLSKVDDRGFGSLAIMRGLGERFGNSDALSLEIHDEIEILVSRNTFENFAILTNAFQLPSSCESANSDLLIASWDGRFPGFGVTTTSPKPHRQYTSYTDHFDLIWTATGFQLKSYNGDDGGSRCRCIQPPKPNDPIPLKADFSGLNLVLTPKDPQSQIPFRVTISDAGKAYVSIDPIDPLFMEKLWMGDSDSAMSEELSLLSLFDTDNSQSRLSR